MSPASCEVVTSTLRRRRPLATAGSQHSSRWKRIVRAIGLPGLKEFLELRRRGLRLQILDETLPFLDVGVDFLLVIVVIGESRMHLGESDRRVAGHDFIGTHSHPFVAYCYVLDLDAVSLKPGLATADAGSADDMRRLKGLCSWNGRGFHEFHLTRNSWKNQRKLGGNEVALGEGSHVFLSASICGREEDRSDAACRRATRKPVSVHLFEGYGVTKAMGSRRLWGHEGYGVTKAMGSRRLWGHEGYGVTKAMGARRLWGQAEFQASLKLGLTPRDEEDHSASSPRRAASRSASRVRRHSSSTLRMNSLSRNMPTTLRQSLRAWSGYLVAMTFSKASTRLASDSKVRSVIVPSPPDTRTAPGILLC